MNRWASAPVIESIFFFKLHWYGVLPWLCVLGGTSHRSTCHPSASILTAFIRVEPGWLFFYVGVVGFYLEVSEFGRPFVEQIIVNSLPFLWKVIQLDVHSIKLNVFVSEALA